VDAGHTIPSDQLIDRIWGAEPPNRVRNVLAGYVARLRATVPAEVGRLRWHCGGYLLEIAPERVDLWRFRQLTERAATTAGDGRAELFDRALSLWHGPAFGGTHGMWLRNLADALDTEVLAAEIARTEHNLELGRHQELVARLPGLAARHPLNEKLASQLMLALYRCDRAAEALAGYAQVAARLRDELGVDPGPALRDLHQRILHSDPGLRLPSAPSPAPVGTPRRRSAEATIPRQLPAGPAHFTGRSSHLRQLDRGSRIITIVGPPGVGKSALTLHWAHSVTNRFPDGQLFLDLRGFDRQLPPVSPEQALARLLRGLGVPAERIPAEADEQASRYRTLLATRRVLVVLDNAASSAQVRQLLPGGGDSQVVVTSRHRLDGLATGAAGSGMTLRSLSRAESCALLIRVLGRRRVMAEPDAARAVGDLCGGLPLALRIAANHLANRPELRIAEFSLQLTDQHQRLDALATEDGLVSVRAVFSLSYDSLDERGARALRLCGLASGPTLGLPAAAAMFDTRPDEAALVLDRLRGGHLLEPVGSGRYQLHDLMRVYAAERAELAEPVASRNAAVRRLRLWYLSATTRAHQLLSPGRYQGWLIQNSVEATPPRDDGLDLPDPPSELVDYPTALRWCDAQAPELLAAVRQADLDGDHEITWRLSLALGEFFELRRPYDDWLTTFDIGLTAARRCGNLLAEAALLAGIGMVHYYPRRFGPAMEHFRQALRIWRTAGDQWGEGLAVNCIANVAMETRRLSAAVRCYRHALRLLDLPETARDAGVVLNNLAEACCLLGSFDEALEHANRSLQIAARAGSRRIEVFSHCHAGSALAGLGRLDEAREHLGRALDLARRMDSRHATAWTLHYLGELAARTGEPGEARRYWQEAVELFLDLADPQADDLRRSIAELGPA
jgi:DNA-binding SARP family transcriptional activator